MKRRTQRKNVDLGNFGWKPRILTHQVFAATAVLVVCLFAGAGLLDRYIKEGGSSYIAAVIAATLVDLANGDRAEAAVSELTVNPTLVAAAQAKANDMAEKGYFAHETPEGYDSWHWFKQVGYQYTYAGENLAVDFSESIDVERAWMASPTHRENIVNGNYTEIGIAVAYGTYKGRPAIFAVQMFGRPSAAELKERAAVSAPVVAAPSVSQATPPAASPGVTLGETSILAAEEIPWWASLVSEPKKMLRYAYYLIGLLILGALFFDFELELKWHHMRHARRVGYIFATMSMLFIAADWLFFAQPVVAELGKFIQ